MRTVILKDKKQIALNSDIELGEQEGNGKGRYFVSRFIEPGIAHYDELGDILITKETLNKFIHTMVGAPVIIDHEDVTDKNVDKLRVGSVSKVWFNEMDGYFYCEGILTDPEAIDLVKNKGWNVSCAYSFQSVPKEMHNGKKIDLEFIDGEFLHLAIVKNPRYEGANIVVNKNDDDLEWITVKGNHIPVRKGQSKDEAVKEFLEGKKEGGDSLKGKYSKEDADFDEEQAKKDIEEAKKQGYKDIDSIADYLGLDPDEVTALTGEGYEDGDEDKDEEASNKTKNSIGDIAMQVLNELKEFIKNVVSNEKEEEMKEVKNEDKRKLIDEVGGILKDKVDEELWRTVVGKLEKIAYEPSEDSKADNEDDEKEEAKNKCKNEEDEKEEKDEDVTENEEDEKEDEKAENKKVKNSMKDIVMGGTGKAQEQKLYISRKERLEEGNKY